MAGLTQTPCPEIAILVWPAPSRYSASSLGTPSTAPTTTKSQGFARCRTSGGYCPTGPAFP